MTNDVIYLEKNLANTIRDNMPSAKVCSSLAFFYSNFSDSTRLKILIALSISEMCVNDLSSLLGLNQTTVSHQLKYLKASGAVTCTRRNKYIFYSVTNKLVSSIMLNGVDFIIGN